LYALIAGLLLPKLVAASVQISFSPRTIQSRFPVLAVGFQSKTRNSIVNAKIAITSGATAAHRGRAA
jgi:hypothetical protein